MTQMLLKKVPEITLLFWIMKIAATTLGETAGDLLSMTLTVGYGISSLILVGIFFFTLTLQLSARRYNPTLYWIVILSTSTAGTTMSDFMDRTLHFGYTLGSFVLVSLLSFTLFLWYKTEKTLSVSHITTKRAEIFYWIAILFSNTLGTAFGDFLADSSGLGFGASALLVASAIAIIILLSYYTKISRVLLFWLAFVLTRPLGATFGDLLTKGADKGGLGFGTIGSSLVLGSILILLIIYTTQASKQKNRSDGVH